MTYADTYQTRSEPTDEQSQGEWRIVRNGKLYARRETLGAAKAVVSRVQSYAGTGDRWAIRQAGDRRNYL